MAAHRRGPKPYEQLSPSARRLRRQEEWFAREYFLTRRRDVQRHPDWIHARAAIEKAERSLRYRSEVIRWNKTHPHEPPRRIPRGPDRSPDGEWARALKTLGEKRKTDMTSVGDTPKFTRTEVWYYKRGVPVPESLRGKG